MIIYKLSTGDEVYKYQKSIVVQFCDNRKVLSTSFINGGYREDLKNIFNHDENPGAGMACALKGANYGEHFSFICEEIGLDTKTTAGISTAASMENVSIKSENYKDLTVTAIVTGGIEVNGGRVGDPSSYYEYQGNFENIVPGTINIILIIDANLPAETMTRALVTATEAKVAAIQELMEGSKYSRGIATGSGTDGTIIVSNSKSKMELLFAGKHSKLGELIGICVKKAVKEALFLQSGLCAKKQHSMLRRIKRFGVDEETIWQKYKCIINNIDCGEKTIFTKAEFINNVEVIDIERNLVTLTSLYVHLLDQLDWGLLNIDEILEEGIIILHRIESKFKVNKKLCIHDDLKCIKDKDINDVIEIMIDKLVRVMVYISGGLKND